MKKVIVKRGSEILLDFSLEEEKVSRINIKTVRETPLLLEQLNDPDYNYTVLGYEPLFHRGTAIELYLYNGSDYASFFFNPSCTIEFR